MSVLTTIARGDDSRVAERRRSLARTDEEWRALWAAHAGPITNAPAVDLTKVIVAAAFSGEQPSAGHTLEITEAPAASADRGVVLTVDETGPDRGTVAAGIITSPFHFVAIAREAGDVSWIDGAGAGTEDRSSRIDARNGRASRLAPRTSTSSSSTGLEPRTASALAYLAGPFSAALILFAETSNDQVRFHAWQSIVGLGGLGLAIIASYVLAFVVMFVSATAASLMMAVAFVIWFVLALVWVICLWKAWSGERWKLPFAGDYAERFV